MYGKTLISVKPLYADKLSESAKRDITNQIHQICTLGSEPVFIDPEFIDIEIKLYLDIDLSKTNISKQNIESIAIETVNVYNDTQLNLFNNDLREVDLTNDIKQSNSGIVSVFTEKTFSKVITVNTASSSEYNVNFGNPIIENSIKSSIAINGLLWSYYDVNGIIYAKNKNTTLQMGTVDYKSGIIKFKLKWINTQSFINMTWYATPEYPDIHSIQNNILRISKTRINNDL